MNALQAHPALQKEATTWVIRLTSGRSAPEDVAAARAWCEISPAHRAAFEEARRVWRLAGETSVAPVAEARKLRAFAMAASLALIVVVFVLSSRLNWTADERTAAGEQHRIVLADGSAVTLDSATALDIDYTASRRHLALRQGQALFEVAHDSARPFVVEGLHLSATALGTVYAVRRIGERQEVIVQQGSVAVAVGDNAAVILQAGQRVAVTDASLGPVQAADLQSALAWQRGALVFKLAPLSEVVAEINRHRPGYIVLANPELRDLQVSGVFRLSELDDALATLASAFPIDATYVGRYLVVLR